MAFAQKLSDAAAACKTAQYLVLLCPPSPAKHAHFCYMLHVHRRLAAAYQGCFRAATAACRRAAAATTAGNQLMSAHPSRLPLDVCFRFPQTHSRHMDTAGAAAAAPETKWHAVSADEALRLLETTEAGLSNEEAAKRLEEYGRNALTPPPKPTFLRRLWNQINTCVACLGLVWGTPSVPAVMSQLTRLLCCGVPCAGCSSGSCSLQLSRARACRRGPTVASSWVWL